VEYPGATLPVATVNVNSGSYSFTVSSDWPERSDWVATVIAYGANNGQNVRVTAGPITIRRSSSSGRIVIGNRVMPQLVFGGGWSTRVYFSNISSSTKQVQLRFYDNNGLPLPVGGSSTASLDIPSGSTTDVEAPDLGGLVQGWATFDLQEGVDGYAVFRQRAAGRPDQEAVVPFVTYTGSKWTMTWDERAGVRAGVAAVNLDTARSVSVAVTVKDNQGAVLFNGALPVLASGQKYVFLLRDVVPTVNGRYGVAEFVPSTGQIAILGLRFDDGGALTTILSANR
jgi:hypothetical protein